VRPVAHAPAFTPSPAALALAARLSLPQQVAQLFMVSVDGRGTTAPAGTDGPGWGGFVLDSSNFSSDAQVKSLVAALRAAGSTGGRPVPLLAATQEGGPDTAFRDLPPQSEAVIGATGQPSVATAQALAAGKRLRSLGLAMTIAPLADVDTPGGPLSGRLFSVDPAAVARFGLAALSGYAQAGVISAVGHFPGSGGASADPDQMTATVGGGLDQLRSRDLIPFAAITAQAPVIMMSNAAYAAFDGVTPAGLLRSAVTLLRGQFAFAGAVMSDDLDATLQATGSDPGSVALQALQAGDDLLYITGPGSEHQQAFAGVLAAAQRSVAVQALVREALLRDLTLKLRFGVAR
jgi:beta-N-acetylhexosaminidase